MSDVVDYIACDDGIDAPIGFPCRVSRKPASQPLPPAPWQRMTLAEYEQHLADNAATYAAWRASQPSPAATWSTLDFLLRFTPEERAAARSSAIPEVQDFLDLLRAAGEVRSDHPLTQQGMGLLVMAGIITAERRDEILGG